MFSPPQAEHFGVFRSKKQIFFVLKVTEAILVGFCSKKLDVLRGSDDSIMTSRSLWLLERGRLSHGSDDSIITSRSLWLLE